MNAINTPTYMRLREQLRSDIVSGFWPLGSHLTLSELSSHYQVSANPVREALLQLQGEGVIDMRMNRGAVIPTVDARYVDDLYRIRGAIQMMLAKQIAIIATPVDIDRLRALSSAYQAASKSENAFACVQANRELHRFMDGLSGNSLAFDMLEGRSSLVDALRAQIGYGQGRTELANEQHNRLIDAISNGDTERASQISLEHTETSRLDLQNALRSLASVQ
jgi:DNA-binding GntR family transcriptional regulator